jgi:predicted neutral ceramidase superfamily lipid hydrolase
MVMMRQQMTIGSGDEPPAPGEPAEHGPALDRELDQDLNELLQEIRVVLPGIEVLFAFLITLPFTERFGAVTQTQRLVYFVALLCAALSTALLIAPSAHRRLLIHQRLKARTLQIANRLVIAGIVLLACAATSVVFVISDVLFGNPIAGLVAGLIAGTFSWLWFGWPLVVRARR